DDARPVGCVLSRHQRPARRDWHAPSSLQAGPIPSGGAPRGVFFDSSAPPRTPFRLRCRRSPRRCSAIAFALSRPLLPSAPRALRPTGHLTLLPFVGEKLRFHIASPNTATPWPPPMQAEPIP